MHPYGDVNEIVVDMLVKKGVTRGLTARRAVTASPTLICRRSMVFGNDLKAQVQLQTFVRVSG
jgi:hypothetical protein